MVPEYGDAVLAAVFGGRNTLRTAHGRVCKGMRMTTKRKAKRTVRNSAVSGEKKPKRHAPASVTASPVHIKPSSRIAPLAPSFRSLPFDAGTPHFPFSRAIPTMYNETYIRVLPRDVHHLFLLWEMAPSAIKKMETADPAYSKSPSPLARVYEVRHEGTPQEERRSAGDFPLEKEVGSRYIGIPVPGHAYRVELGFIAPSGEFVSVCSSNTVTCPAGRIQTGEERMGSKTDTKALLEQSLRGASLRAFDSGSAPDNFSPHTVDHSVRMLCSSPVNPLPGPAAPDRTPAP